MMRKLFVLLCAVMITSWVGAQDGGITVTGSVKDKNTGETLIGVNIMEEGTHNGTATDIDGNYSLKVSKNAVLVYSYVGYTTQKEKVNGRSSINVSLAPDTELDEVIVVGYTSMKKSDILGAVSKVDSKSLTATSVASTEQALQGRIAGVQVSSNTGAPGAGVSVRIRGVGSAFSKNDPLYIVDGIPVANGLDNISPNDIEYMTVLKDAAAAAVYGSRATNGVVLVVTKKGKEGKAKVSYNGTFGVQNAVNLVDMANTSEYVKIYNEATAADNVGTAIPRDYITDDMLPGLADVNHVKEIFRVAPMTSHELSVSGGNGKTNYLISGSYYNQQGIIKHSGYDRGTLRASINTEVRKWLQLGLMANGSVATTKSVPSSGDGYENSEGGSVVRYAMFRNPAIPVYNQSGALIDKPSTYFGNSIYDTFFGNGYNPVGIAEYADRTNNLKSLFSRVNAKIILPYGLDLNTNFGFDYKNNEFTVYNQTWGDDGRINNPNGISVNNTTNLDWTFNSVLNFNKVIAKKHTISALVGFEAIRQTVRFMNNSDSDFSIWDKDLVFIGGGKKGKLLSTQGGENSSLVSIFAQFNYDFNNRYSVNGTLREDGSSRFVGKNRWGTFYSVSGGWNIRNEAFMEDVTLFSQLKLRAGYGKIGNQDIAESYAYTDRWSPNHVYPFGSTPENGFTQYKLGNPDLKWETSNQLNVGLDFGFLNGALTFSVDYFDKVTHNALMLESLPPSAGNVKPKWVNNGKILNRGVDIEAAYHHLFKDGRFDVTLNGGFLHNEVLEFDGVFYDGRVDNGINATRTMKGYPIGSFYMYEMEGIFQDELEIVSSPYQGQGIKPGDVKFRDVDGNGVIDDNDRTYAGSAIPKFTLGLNLSAEWKGFDISAFFQGAFGQKIYNQVMMDSEGFYRGFNVTKRYYDNRWTPSNPSNEYPRASWRAKSNNARVSTRFLEDGSYLRLKNLQLGYTFKTSKWGVERLRLYLAATNLLTFTKYSGSDPEMTVSANAAGEGDRANGIDWGTYPAARTYTFGVNLTF